ncbi:MAG: metal ABC transporter ATP-binding protein [Spirochaetaceae bacterium]
MSSRRTIASFEDVTFAYDRVPVLKNVSVTIEEGDFVSVIGPNGAGKTTLVKLLLGLLEPTKGSVTLFGGAPRNTRRFVGYVPQYSSFDHRFPILVRDVVRMGAMEAGLSLFSRREASRVRHALERVNMEGAEKSSFNALSGGQRQRVLIARALAVEPKLLIMDEPTSNVDSAAEERLRELLQELNREMTLMLITHDLGFVAPVVNKVLCVNVAARIHETTEVTDEMIRGLFGSNQRFVEHRAHV